MLLQSRNAASGRSLPSCEQVRRYATQVIAPRQVCPDYALPQMRGIDMRKATAGLVSEDHSAGRRRTGAAAGGSASRCAVHAVAFSRRVPCLRGNAARRIDVQRVGAAIEKHRDASLFICDRLFCSDGWTEQPLGTQRAGTHGADPDSTLQRRTATKTR